MSPRQAVELAKKYVTAGLKYSYGVGNGKGPLNHLAAFFPGHVDDVDVLEVRYQAFNGWGEKVKLRQLPVLNVIIGGPLCKGKDYGELTRMAVQNGAQLIQLREKEGETKQLVDMASEKFRVCHENNALFVVNDRVDVALASGADGVHIGQDDLAPKMARALLGPEKIIGVSVGNVAEAEIALADGADYLGVGPVYPTISKECRFEACGSELINDIVTRVPLPVIAIGGITPENTPPILKAGAAGVAVISAILGDPKPEDVVQRFMQSF
jgi:thiamine-phosphate diphosphorylase